MASDLATVISNTDGWMSSDPDKLNLPPLRRPSPIPALTPQAELAIFARALYREGYDDHRAGHITVRQPDDTFLTLPYQFGWDEVTPDQIIRINNQGIVIEGDWDVTPAIALHLEFHAARTDSNVVIHQHPRFGTIWSALRRIPAAYDQISAFMDTPEIVLYDDFAGDVTSISISRDNVRAIGDKNYAILANHGVLVSGADVQQCFCRAMALEWRCKQAWYVEAIGGGTPVPKEGQAVLLDMQRRRDDRPPMQWEWVVRRELRADPGLLG